MNKIYEPLDSEENELIESIRRDEWEEAKDARKLKKQALEYAEATVKKDKRMNIRISERDLKNLKRKALEEGIPYQTMVSMVLHKYLTGRLSEHSS
ncbi:MAG: antitoxin [Spirochaetaceae bacterium]|nr:MAG: antitoxin [Spirochaetaceae bacterium]